MYFILKICITALIIVSISELARRYTMLAAALASLPLTSILAFIWTYYDTKDVQKVAELSYSIFWLVIPSLIFFIAFPLLVKSGFKFAAALFLSCVIMLVGYAIFIYMKKLIG